MTGSSPTALTIGYYVHHVGQGHLQRATAVATELHHRGVTVTGLSTLVRPPDWSGRWQKLPPDDLARYPTDATANGALHRAPRGDPGLRARMAAIASWLNQATPAALVSDLSVEVTALSRLHGVPVISTVLPGRREDAAHQLGFRLADLIVAPWPNLGQGLCLGLDAHRDKVRHIGGLSRFDTATAERQPFRPRDQTVLVLSGSGGTTNSSLAWGLRSIPGWRIIRRGPGEWVADVWPDLCAADVVITHAGLGAIADIAAARKPALVIPELRPHDEQAFTAAALHAADVALVLDSQPPDWGTTLRHARAFDTTGWARWSTGDAASRFADTILDVAGRPGSC